MTMLTDKEKKVLKETRLRNLKRKHAKLTQHPELADEALKIQEEINQLQ